MKVAKRDLLDASTSARKLASIDFEDVIVKLTHFYRIIEFVSVFSAIQNLVQCKTCKRDVSFNETGYRGLSFKITVKCACGTNYIPSGPFIRNDSEINTRIVFVMRLLGVGLAGINLFCAMMDIGTGLSKDAYDRIVQHIYTASKNHFDKMSLRVVEKEKEENKKRQLPCENFKVSGDGSWKKRGFTSLFGVTTLIAHYTGKVIDLVVKSSVCKACSAWKNKEDTEEFADWYESHQSECTSNHSGSAGKMEVDSVQEMFNASSQKFGVHYTNYIGDGDSKTFQAILNLNPYGDECPVRKSECVNHVEKRMGTRLRNIKKEKKLGGKGKLTDTLIKKLTKYYDLAIMRNPESVENMQRDIMATYLHSISTDKKPRHENCPSAENSWCKFRRAESLGVPYTHPEPLHPVVAESILPIYKDLSRKDLLERCLGGFTQNANESFNSLIWRLAPKHLHCGRKIIEIAAYLAATMFNEGYLSLLGIMSEVGIIIGTTCRNFSDKVNQSRVTSQNRRSKSANKRKIGLLHKEQQLQQNELYEEVEGLLYGPGIAD